MNENTKQFICEVGKTCKEQREFKQTCLDLITTIIKEEVGEGVEIDLFNSDLPHSDLAVYVPSPPNDLYFITCWLNKIAVWEGKLQMLCGEQGDGDGFWYEPSELNMDLDDVYQILKFLEEWCEERANVK